MELTPEHWADMEVPSMVGDVSFINRKIKLNDHDGIGLPLLKHSESESR